MDGLEGKVAFVTGGASGIGLGICQALVDAGARVMIADLRADHIDEAMRALGPAAEALQLDVRDREGFARAAAETEARLGPVQILVANAGVGITGPIAEAGYADWDFGLGVNLGGAVNALVTFLPRMIGQGLGGHVVLTSSQAGVSPSPRGATVYAASKAALVGMAEAMREELADHRIGVSVLLAGFFRSRIQEIERYRQPGAAPAAPPGAAQTDSPIWKEPIEAGRMTVEAIRSGDLYIATHGELKGWVEGRFEEILAAYPPVEHPALAEALGRKRPADPMAAAAKASSRRN
jgi:NAD(P)-dependent dehydrogenase (short-subunit alcohol dehydrogenase family)